MNISCPDFYLQKLWKKIYLNSKISFISCFIIGLLTHLFMLANKLPNHDDINQLFTGMHRATSGRWFLFFPASFSSDFSLPWLNGLLCILYISLSAAIVTKCLNIKSSFNSFLIGGIMITFPTVCTTLPYMNSADGYFFALLLACIAVYLTDKYSLGFLPGALLLTLSLGIYQAYFSFATALAVSILLKTVVTTKPRISPPNVLIIKTGKFLSLLILGLLFYMVITKLIQVELSSYMGIDSMGNLNLSELPSMITGAYQNIFKFFFTDEMLSSIYALRYLLPVIILIVLVLPIFVNKLYESKFNMVFYLLLIITLPLACNLVYVMSFPFAPHLLMVYSFTMIFITIISLSEILHDKPSASRTKNSFPTLAVLIISFLPIMLVFDYAVLSNQAYLKLHLAYEQGYAYSNRLLSRIESLDGFSTDCHIYFVGIPSAHSEAIPEYPVVDNLTGIINDIPAAYSYPLFLKNYFGNVLEIASTYFQPTENAAVLLPFDVDNMSIYPNAGSIKKIGRNIVIKFSEVEKTN